MKRRTEGILDATAAFLKWLDEIRDAKLRALLESRLFTPLLVVGLSADILTKIRCAAAIAILGILSHSWAHNYGISFPLRVRLLLIGFLGLGFVTDLLDGPLARLERKWRIRMDERGAHLDPLADKLLTLPLLFYCLLHLDWWAIGPATLIILGDVLVTAFRRYAKRRGITIPANTFGKFKMVFLGAAIMALVLWNRPNVLLFLTLSTVALTLGAISIGRHAFLLKYALEVRQEATPVESRKEASP